MGAVFITFILHILTDLVHHLKQELWKYLRCLAITAFAENLIIMPRIFKTKYQNYFITNESHFLHVLCDFDSSSYVLSKYNHKFSSVSNTATTLHLNSSAESFPRDNIMNKPHYNTSTTIPEQ